MELPGLKYSTLANTVQGKSLVILLSRIKGVLPIVSRILFNHMVGALFEPKVGKGGLWLKTKTLNNCISVFANGLSASYPT
jgi:hypothetical protein